MNRKAPAFTLIELAVVMALTSVVFSLGYLAFGLLQKGVGDYQRAQNQQMESYALGSLFYHDFQACETVHVQGNQLHLNDRDRWITYENHEGFLLRLQQTRRDTFYSASWSYQPSQVQLQLGENVRNYSLHPKNTSHGSEFE